MGRFVLGFLLGGVMTFGAQRYHLLQTNEGFYLVPKLSAEFSEAYVDIRHFDVGDWTQHKSLAAAIIKAKKDHLLHESSAESFRQGVQEAVQHLTGSAN